MKAAIIASGKIENLKKIAETINKEYDYIICADGGAVHAYQMNLIPDLIVGDYDSISQDVYDFFLKEGVTYQRFPKEKDDTDTQLAIDIALKKGAEDIGLFGCTGSRMDHTLSNIFNLLYIREKHAKGRIIDDNNELFLARDKTTIHGKKGDLVSLISLTKITEGITLKGFKYPLNKAVMLQKNSLGISNELETEEGIILKEKGELLVIRSND